MAKIQLHIHTKYSHDSILPFWLVYWRCIFTGINYVAITEHNNISGAVAFSEYCKRRGNKIHVIIGEEIMTTGGEIIGLYLNKEIPCGLTPSETVQKIKEQNGLVYIPHPYDLKRIKTVLKEQYIEELKGLIDCIEVHNGRNIDPVYDKYQNLIAERYHLKKVIGSDAHTSIEIGKNYIISDIEPSSPEEFLALLEMNESYDHSCISIAHKITILARIVKFVQRGDFNGLYRTIIKRFKRKKC